MTPSWLRLMRFQTLDPASLVRVAHPRSPPDVHYFGFNSRSRIISFSSYFTPTHRNPQTLLPTSRCRIGFQPHPQVRRSEGKRKGKRRRKNSSSCASRCAGWLAGTRLICRQPTGGRGNTHDCALAFFPSCHGVPFQPRPTHGVQTLQVSRNRTLVSPMSSPFLPSRGSTSDREGGVHQGIPPTLGRRILNLCMLWVGRQVVIGSNAKKKKKKKKGASRCLRGGGGPSRWGKGEREGAEVSRPFSSDMPPVDRWMLCVVIAAPNCKG
ncbi:hypothetical protein LX32DRAFT_248659 [Colletotrichum zoysiae]|uniref:Uncharacterized protein n=1 Tax=Colletotrichum zoysiae TaxID=1216348 RepID=A0AAD9LTP7_9PEZI|nr:hypothetical protein LX32DRAFT_248659 [Colletotrichum zoysiae]